MFLLRQSTHRTVLRHHPEIGHLFVPNLVARIPSERGGYFVRTNAQGFRSDIEFTPERGDRPRILFFGDSVTAGDGCENHERFSELVGEALGAEVFNFGLSGSGTDQQLLIFERFAKAVAADLIVLGVWVENIERVKVGFRESIDRATGRHVLVPKPYFTLGAGGGLELHNVPVPTERPDAASVDGHRYQHRIPAAWKSLHGAVTAYRKDPRLAPLRRLAGRAMPGLRSRVMRLSGFQPYRDYLRPKTGAWPLLRAIIRRFAEVTSPTPLLLVPIPTFHYYFDEIGAVYRPLYAELADPARGLEVLDLTDTLRAVPRDRRRDLVFKKDKAHFSPFGHEIVAKAMVNAIQERGLLQTTGKAPNKKEEGIAEIDRRSLERDVVTGQVDQRAAGEATSPRGGVPEQVDQRGGAEGTSPRGGVLAVPPQGDVPSAMPKGRHTQAKPTYILGISGFYHDSAAALIRDGQIVAASEEERFTRIKNDRRFPHFASNFCLEQGGISQHDLAAVVFYDSAPLTFERLLHSLAVIGDQGEDAWTRAMPSWIQYKLHLPRLIRNHLRYEGPVLHDLHHRSHAASAFYPSPFERAAILTIDGVGEWATAAIGVGRDGRVEMLKEMRFPHSLGLLYSAFTQFTGFKVNSGEYKMMGLAPYGEPRFVQTILDHLVDLHDDGSLTLNLDYFAYLAKPSMTNERFATLFGGPARGTDDRITKREIDLARSIQVVTEEAMLRMARHAKALTGESKLCMAGGVALNCVANGRILREGPFEAVWIQPAAGDAGCALGAALDVHHHYFGNPRVMSGNGRPGQGASYWGPSFPSDEVRAFLETFGYPYRRLAPAERAAAIATLLDQGKVVGHFANGVEFGPRALGARSILGDARNQDMQANLNLKIKYRESFRPFAPSVLAERVSEYFELDRESPYMLLVAPVRVDRRRTPEAIAGDDLLPIVRQTRSDIPAVTHVDYSARVQTVTRADSPEYYDLIKAFADRTGCAVIVNTSFNVRGEPIVCTPYDAYRCFMRTEMDALVLGDCLLLKPEQPVWPEGRGVITEEIDSRYGRAAIAPAFARALAETYTRHFLPVAERLRRAGALGFDLGFTRGRSGWVECRDAAGTRASFTIDPALDQAHPDPAAMAAAISAHWTRGDAAEALRPILTRLLALERRHPGTEPLAEEVSESMYVMF
jgi:carbamoyltransferase